MSKIFDNLEIITSGDTSNPFLKIGDGTSYFRLLIDPSNGKTRFDFNGGVGSQDVNFGKNADTDVGSSSVSVGYNSYSSGGGIGIGNGASSTGGTSVAIGSGAKTSNSGTISIGSNATASGLQGIAIGRSAEASSFDCISIGRNTVSSGNGSITIGHTASGNLTNSTANSLALGWDEDVTSFLLAKSSNSYLNTSANFAIGHTTPLSKIHLSGETRVQGTTSDSTTDALKILDSAGTINAVFRNDGKAAIGTAEPTDRLHVNARIGNEHSQFRLEKSYTPTGNIDTNGQIGSFAWDGEYFYIKTANGWGRISISYAF